MIGDNAKAAVITVDLQESLVLVKNFGADPWLTAVYLGLVTLLLQELIHSRNWRAGDALGRENEDIERNMGMVIEGISTPKAAYEIAQELGVWHANYNSNSQIYLWGKLISRNLFSWCPMNCALKRMG